MLKQSSQLYKSQCEFVVCKADGCNNEFEKTTGNREYCSLVCGQRQNQKKNKDKYQKNRRDHRQRRKAFVVQALGGECKACGYKKYQGALEVHHLNGREGSYYQRKGYQLHCWGMDHIKKELARGDLVLLCANCHREVENGITIL